MKKVLIGLVLIILGLPLVTFLVVGPSPLPPSGPMGAKQVVTAPERARVVASMTEWLARQAGGRATQFYDLTWEGGETAPGTFAPGTALYSGFKGVIVVAHWPFVLAYGGHLSDGAAGGYHVEITLDGLEPSRRTGDSLAPADRGKVVAMVEPLLAASGMAGVYAPGQVAGWTSIGQGSDGVLTATAPLPASKLGAKPGSLRTSFSREFDPIFASVDTPTDR